MRAAYAALFVGLVLGLVVATAVLSDPTLPPSSVAAALGLDGPDPPALARRRAEAVAVLSAACMARLGLVWAPLPEPLPSFPDPDLGPVAWADRWGFGLSTTIGQPAPPGVADPNHERILRMSPVVRGQYLAALDGPAEDAGGGGCRAEANRAVHGLRDRHLVSLRADLTALDRAIAADPAMAEATTTWNSCVAVVGGALPSVRGTVVPALMAAIETRIRAAGPGLTGLADIMSDERRVAGTVARCDVAYAASRAAVARVHEAGFIARHRSELEAVGAAIRAAEAALPTLPARVGPEPPASAQPAAGP